MVPRPTYRAMVQHARRIVQQIAQDPHPFGVTPTQLFSYPIRVGDRDVRIRKEAAEEVWPSIAKDLGLVPDGFGCWTLPGRAITMESARQTVDDALKKLGL